MQQMLRMMVTLFSSLGRRAPALPFGGQGPDWLPPVLGPGDWSNATLASMADSSARWYFDRAEGSDR